MLLALWNPGLNDSCSDLDEYVCRVVGRLSVLIVHF